MNKPLIKTESWVTFLGAGDANPLEIEEILTLAPFLVAADGGAATAVKAGHIPQGVIGDLDSLPQFARESIPSDHIHFVEDQNTTDFEKCLDLVSAPLILGLGFTGGRIDHELAVYSALAQRPSRPCIILGTTDLVFASPGDVSLDLPIGTRLSLFPMALVTGQTEGLRWPINGLSFEPAGRVGTSNQVTGPVRLQFDHLGTLVILPKVMLPQVIAALRPD